MADETADHNTDEAPRKGRSNAILTYEKLEELSLGIQRVDLNVSAIRKDMVGVDEDYKDHEVRLRVLEQAHAARTGSTGAATWIYQAMWPLAMFCMGALSLYLNSRG